MRARPARSCSSRSRLGVLSALLIVAQAWLLADVVARAFLGGRSLAQLQTPLIMLLLVVLARAAVAWAAELAASRSSARAKSQLRAALLQRVAALGLDSSREQRTGELAVLATRGIDALDGYFSLYLPQLFLAVIVPVVVIVAVLWNDWISAAIIAFTIPLIPLFMALVGAATRERMDRQFRIAGATGRPLPRRRRRTAHAEGLRAGQGPGRRRSARSPSATAGPRSRRCGSPSCPR